MIRNSSEKRAIDQNLELNQPLSSTTSESLRQGAKLNAKLQMSYKRNKNLSHNNT